MRIAAQSNIAEIESALQTLAESDDDESLQLPLNLRHLAGGAEAALAQLVVTWAQQSIDRELATFIESEAQTQGFVRRLPGLAASLCAKDAFGRSGIPISVELRAAALERLDLLQSARPSRAYRGSSAEIVCADHIGRGAPYLLYVPDERGGARLRPRQNFTELSSWLFTKSIPSEYRDSIDPEAAEALGGMLFELFKNTEEHGLVDAGGNVLDVSIRAIKTNHHELKPEVLARIVRGFSPLETYCKTLRPPEEAAYTHIFELSVLDSGPGFAVTHERRPLEEISRVDERRAVRECFGQSSAKGESRFGQGLPHVLRLLRRQRGFLRLRTGRVSIYGDFSAPKSNDDCEILKFNTSDGGQLAPVSGSLLTILIPMRR